MEREKRSFSSDALLHPERMRIVAEFVGRRTRSRTTGELRERLPDIPIATLYRHLARLTKAGMLVVSDTRAKRGATEKTYVLAANPMVGMDDLAAPADFLRGVTSYVAMLLADVGRYVRSQAFARRSVDPMVRAFVVAATDDEFRALSAELSDAIVRAARVGATQPVDGRRRRMIYLATVPDVESNS